jgi:hypothetical protein
MHFLVPILYFLYRLFIDRFDLYPWNDLDRKTKCSRRLDLFIYYVPTAIVIACHYTLFDTALMWAFALTWFMFLFYVFTWWVPYFFGASISRKRAFTYQYGRTSRVLPARKDHPIPDNQHIWVGIWLVSMLVTQWLTMK